MLTEAPPNEAVIRVQFVRDYLERSKAYGDVRRLIDDTLEIYPSVPVSRHKTRLRRAFNRAIQNKLYPREVRDAARAELRRAFARCNESKIWALAHS